jgi:hypothetical protein
MEALREMTYDFHPEAEKEFLSAINYYEESHSVYILAVMHLRRDPDYWKSRLR